VRLLNKLFIYQFLSSLTGRETGVRLVRLGISRSHRSLTPSETAKSIKGGKIVAQSHNLKVSGDDPPGTHAGGQAAMRPSLGQRGRRVFSVGRQGSPTPPDEMGGTQEGIWGTDVACQVPIPPILFPARAGESGGATTTRPRPR
jgi:hypothetical protein